MKYYALIPLALAAFVANPALADHHEKGGKHAKHFEKSDKDGDGVISKSEFMDQAEERFMTMDANNDGSISKDEIAAKYKERREKMKEKRAERKAERAEDDAVKDAE